MARAEQYARSHPLAYQIRLGLLAVAGYAYIWIVLLLMFALLALLIAVAVDSFLSEHTGGAINLLIKLGWPLLLFIGAILRALWVRFPPPEGIEISRPDAPHLFALVDGLRSALACPPFDHVLLTDEWNAAVTQRPRLGPFGWFENYLTLGVPLMAGLPPDEFRAVLAHEFGHLSRQHGRFGSWIYRIRATWSELLTSLEQTRHRWRGLFEVFLRRFAPYFNAYSFVLARAREREADRVAADLAGGENLGRALVRLDVGGALLKEQFWPSVYRLARDQPLPPEGILPRLAMAVHTGAPAPEARARLDTALRQKTGNEDTHPSLAERLAALGLDGQNLVPAPRAAADPSAAQELLGGLAGRALSRLDEAWRDGIAFAWRKQHVAAERGLARLGEIAARAAAGPLPLELAWQRIVLTLELDGERASEPLLRDLLTAYPDHAYARFLLGKLLVERGDAAGVEHLQRVMELDPANEGSAAELLAAYSAAHGSAAEAGRYRARAEAGAELLAQAEAERQGVTAADDFLPHELPAEEVKRLRQEVAGSFAVARAYLVRKAVRYLPSRPYYVLGVVLGRWYHLRTSREDREVVHALASTIAYPGATFIVQLNRHTAKIAKKIRRVPGAELLRR